MLNIGKGGHREIEKYYSMMEVDFDSEELLSKLAIHRAVIKGEMELLIFFDDESKMELGYALVGLKNLYGYVLLKYFGILPWYREHGLGIEAMRLINKRYADTQGIIAEITDFPDADENRQRKLFKFFARFGYVEVPSDFRISGTTAHVMVKPIKGTADIGRVYHRIMLDFYRRYLTGAAMAKMIDIKRKDEI